MEAYDRAVAAGVQTQAPGIMTFPPGQRKQVAQERWDSAYDIVKAQINATVMARAEAEIKMMLVTYEEAKDSINKAVIAKTKEAPVSRSFF